MAGKYMSASERAIEKLKKTNPKILKVVKKKPKKKPRN